MKYGIGYWISIYWIERIIYASNLVNFVIVLPVLVNQGWWISLKNILKKSTAEGKKTFFSSGVKRWRECWYLAWKRSGNHMPLVYWVAKMCIKGCWAQIILDSRAAAIHECPLCSCIKSELQLFTWILIGYNRTSLGNDRSWGMVCSEIQKLTVPINPNIG